jgi:hypothetical protein
MKYIVAALFLSLVGCNIMEGIHQTSPHYKEPVPFSDAWFAKRKNQKR